MSELVKRNGSDLHLTGDSQPFFRIQGQILPASSEKYLSKDLRSFKIWFIATSWLRKVRQVW